MHWFKPYVIKDISGGGTIHLTKLNGEVFPSRINGSRLKVYRDNPSPAQ